MAISFDEVHQLKQTLGEEYQERHDTFKKLRAYYHGKFWEQADDGASTLATIFRDLVGERSAFGPDIKVVNNLLFAIVTKYQSFLSSSPMIRIYTDAPGGTRQIAQAALKERYLYGTWSEGKMTTKLGQAGWFLPLMGHGFLGAFPDIDRNYVCPVLRSPETAFPIPNYDGSALDAVIFAYEARESAVKRAFPKYNPKKPGLLRRLPGVPRDTDPKIWVLEYSDGQEWARFADGQRVNGVEHNLGFNLFDQMKFIDVPGEVWGHGAVEQIVNQVELGNAVESLLFQAVLDNVFPTLVLEDASKAPETIERGPGSVIPLNAGGKAYYLNAPINMAAALEIMGENERQVKQNTSMPDVSMGSFRGSIVTGKAVNELQGAGTGSTVEMVQSNIGPALVAFNEKAIYIAQILFRNDTIYLQGYRPQTMSDLNPRQFAFKAKGSQLIGSARNDLVFQPHLDMQTKVVMNLQLAGAGLVSRKYQRDQAGIPDSEAMDEEILAEKAQDAVVGALLGQLDPTNPDAAINQADAYIETGALPPRPSQTPPAPGPPIPAPSEQQPFLQATLTGGSAGANAKASVRPSEAGAPPGAAPPPASPTGNGQPGEAPAAPGAGAGVSLDQAATAIQGLQNVPGQVFLVGEIVDQQATAGEVEIAVTDRNAIAPIKAGVQFPTAFTVVQGEPHEHYVEVTPGQPIRAGGSEFDIASLPA